MKSLELPLTERINLRTSEHIQFATTEHLEDNEIIIVQKVGLCRVSARIKGLVKLTITQKQWMHTRDGILIEKPKWSL